MGWLWREGLLGAWVGWCSGPRVKRGASEREGFGQWIEIPALGAGMTVVGVGVTGRGVPSVAFGRLPWWGWSLGWFG